MIPISPGMDERAVTIIHPEAILMHPFTSPWTATRSCIGWESGLDQGPQMFGSVAAGSGTTIGALLVGRLVVVSVSIGAGFDDVALQLATTRPSKTTVIARNESASLPAPIRAI
jgi:hypothetical protein